MPHQDFDLESLAAYLHVTPQQALRLADRGKVPGRKVSGQWRFARADIHLWLEDRIGVGDDDELTEVEGVLERSSTEADDTDFSIAGLIPEGAISVPIRGRSRNSVIAEMVDLGVQVGMVWDPEKFNQAVLNRESMHPTALDNGVALLHPRRPMASILAEAFVTVGVAPSGIPFSGARGQLTDIFFLLGSTDDHGHLCTLARLSRLINQPTFLDALRSAASADDARAAIDEHEESIG